MKKFSLILLLSTLIFFTSCTAPSYQSLNIQKSSLRSAGDFSTTMALDTLPTPEQAAMVAAQTKAIASAIQGFLKTGKVGDLTSLELTNELKKLIPGGYGFLLDLLVSQIQGYVLPTGKIGEDNVARLNALCMGIIVGSSEYKVSDKPKDVNAKDLKEPDFEKFGNEFKTAFEKIQQEIQKRSK